ncbi:MAG: flagellar hook-length control protein FliK [Betaproteobacteria bacterium]|nr:flagellar hook-length control protein FliK [Betaproteobacteria bacterium]
MTTITPISIPAIPVMPGGGDMSAATALLQSGKGGSFFGLLAALLNAAAPDTDISPELPADFLANLLDKSQTDLATGIVGREDKFLPEELARLLAREQKTLDKGIDDKAEDSIIALGVLSSPVETDNAPLSTPQELSSGQKGATLPSAPPLSAPKAEVEEASLPAKQGSAAAEKALPPPANLAAKSDEHSSGTKEEKHDFSSFLREAAVLTKAANHAAPRATTSIPTPVASHAWGERLGEQIIWMTRNGQQQVDLKLHPANLGPLSISLNMEGEKATIHFTVATLEVRQAIEDALPRLREMMAATGVSLGQADVDEQTRRETEAYSMTGEREDEEQNLPGQNGEYAENSEGTPDAAGQHGRNPERASILPDMVNGHAMPFAHANGRVGGIDLFA